MKARYLIVEIFLEVCRKNAMVLNEGFTLKIFQADAIVKQKEKEKKISYNKTK